MTQTDSLRSRIARRLTTIAFICCFYGIAVWLGRPDEPVQPYWLWSLGVAAGVMLGCRAHLAGVDLRTRARGVVGAGRRGVATKRYRLR